MLLVHVLTAERRRLGILPRSTAPLSVLSGIIEVVASPSLCIPARRGLNGTSTQANAVRAEF